MNESQAYQLWEKLGAEGKAPTELTNASLVLSSYTAGIDPWIDRLANRYLRGDGTRKGLCRTDAHFKLVLAPYGGGKTHFLLAVGARAREEGFAVSYVPCSEGVSLDDPLEVYRELVKYLYLPNENQPGLSILLNAAIRSKREEIDRYDPPDPDAAFRQWVSTIRQENYPENAFGRVMAAALKAKDEGDSDIGDAAFRWLQGDLDTLTRDERHELRLERIPAANRKQFGRALLFSVIKFLPNTGVYGLVLLMDEVETLFTAKGRALLRILAAMRVIIDAPAGVSGGLPLFGIFSATPDVLEELGRYEALRQRLEVRGASFDEGNDLATQLPLDKVETQETLLAEIGEKLIEVGSRATGYSFDRELQTKNAFQLAQVASERNLDVDARRVFVKTWVNVLNIQAVGDEREFGTEELTNRYQGDFESLRDAEAPEFEP